MYTRGCLCFYFQSFITVQALPSDTVHWLHVTLYLSFYLSTFYILWLFLSSLFIYLPYYIPNQNKLNHLWIFFTCTSLPLWSRTLIACKSLAFFVTNIVSTLNFLCIYFCIFYTCTSLPLWSSTLTACSSLSHP